MKEDHPTTLDDSTIIPTTSLSPLTATVVTADRLSTVIVADAEESDRPDSVTNRKTHSRLSASAEGVKTQDGRISAELATDVPYTAVVGATVGISISRKSSAKSEKRSPSPYASQSDKLNIKDDEPQNTPVTLNTVAAVSTSAARKSPVESERLSSPKQSTRQTPSPYTDEPEMDTNSDDIILPTGAITGTASEKTNSRKSSAKSTSSRDKDIRETTSHIYNTDNESETKNNVDNSILPITAATVAAVSSSASMKSPVESERLSSPYLQKRQTPSPNMNETEPNIKSDVTILPTGANAVTASGKLDSRRSSTKSTTSRSEENRETTSPIAYCGNELETKYSVVNNILPTTGASVAVVGAVARSPSAKSERTSISPTSVGRATPSPKEDMNPLIEQVDATAVALVGGTASRKSSAKSYKTISPQIASSVQDSDNFDRSASPQSGTQRSPSQIHGLDNEQNTSKIAIISTPSPRPTSSKSEKPISRSPSPITGFHETTLNDTQTDVAIRDTVSRISTKSHESIKRNTPSPNFNETHEIKKKAEGEDADILTPADVTDDKSANSLNNSAKSIRTTTPHNYETHPPSPKTNQPETHHGDNANTTSNFGGAVIPNTISRNSSAASTSSHDKRKTPSPTGGHNDASNITPTITTIITDDTTPSRTSSAKYVRTSSPKTTTIRKPSPVENIDNVGVPRKVTDDFSVTSSDVKDTNSLTNGTKSPRDDTLTVEDVKGEDSDERDTAVTATVVKMEKNEQFSGVTIDVRSPSPGAVDSFINNVLHQAKQGVALANTDTSNGRTSVTSNIGGASDIGDITPVS